MNLKDFENNFDEKILERGKALFEKGAVKHVRTTYNDWIFGIEGKRYVIDIALKENLTVPDFTCNCPSGRWHHCKHSAACLYYLREKFGIKKTQKIFANTMSKLIFMLFRICALTQTQTFQHSPHKIIKRTVYLSSLYEFQSSSGAISGLGGFSQQPCGLGGRFSNL